MKRSLRFAFAMTVLAAVAFCADNTLGTWKFDSAKSKAAPGVSPVKELTVVREANGDQVKVTAKGERMDGSKIDTSYTTKHDGQPVTLTGSGLPYDTVATRRPNDNTVTSSNSKSGGKYKATSRFVVSNGGKTGTLTTKGVGADGKAFTSVSVYDKQ